MGRLVTRKAAGRMVLTASVAAASVMVVWANCAGCCVRCISGIMWKTKELIRQRLIRDGYEHLAQTRSFLAEQEAGGLI